MRRSSEPINAFQRAALKVYADGQYEDIQVYRYDEEHGDSLLTFVLAELSDNEECEDLETAISRIRQGIEDLNQVLQALQEETTC
jgi:hypothetical protein